MFERNIWIYLFILLIVLGGGCFDVNKSITKAEK